MALDAEHRKELAAEAEKENQPPEDNVKDSKASVPISSANKLESSTGSQQQIPSQPKQRKRPKNATAKGPILL